MSDIFISYSSYDFDKAHTLVKELRAHGYGVWMDQGGIRGAQDWSSEIVEAINKAKTVIFLISKDSLTSHNCAREIHLASEKHKNILPVVIEDTPLPLLFEYPLAGLQRIRYEQTEAIVQAIAVLGSGKTVLQAMLSQSVIESGIRRLAVLPFEDQSSSKDNEWFADGMMDELINTLGSLSELHVNPRGDVIYYKKNRPKQSEIAADLKCRYIVEGTVQKSGEKIRMRVSLSDAAEHKQLWSEKYDGTFEDIFDFQDRTAKHITEALKLKLAPEEKERIRKKETENAEAYELFMRAGEYFHRQTKNDYERTLSLLEEAVRLDPNFVFAYSNIASTCLSIYRQYIPSPELLRRAETATEKIREIEGETAKYYYVMSIVTLRRGNAEGALRFARRAIETDPNYASGYDALGVAHSALGNKEETVRTYEEYVRLRENDKGTHFNLLGALNNLGDIERLRQAAERAIPVFERYIRLNPDDYFAQVQLANIFRYARRKAEALNTAGRLSATQSLDGAALYNLACLYLNCNAEEKGLQMLRRAVAKGYRDIDLFRRDPDLDPLRGTSEFEELMKELSES